jgi:hypothetical protein
MTSMFFPSKKCMHKCCMQKKKKKKEALAWQAFKTMKGAAEEGKETFDASERTGRARERACISIPGKYIPPDSFCLSLHFFTTKLVVILSKSKKNGTVSSNIISYFVGFVVIRWLNKMWTISAD